MKFEVGKIYGNRFIGNHELEFKFKVIHRTDKTITLEGIFDLGVTEQKKRRISIWNGIEEVMPFGSYSKAPLLTADKEVK